MPFFQIFDLFSKFFITSEELNLAPIRLPHLFSRHVSAFIIWIGFQIHCHIALRYYLTPYFYNDYGYTHLTTVIHRASPVIRIVKLFTQHVVRGDYWVPTNCSPTVNGGVASLIAWLDHSCQKTEVGGKQGHAPCRRILLQ